MHSYLSARLEIILAFAATRFLFRYVLFLFLDWRCVFYLMVLLMLCCFVVCFVVCFYFRSLVLLQVATLDCSWYGWGSKSSDVLLLACLLTCSFSCLSAIFYMSVCQFVWFALGSTAWLLDWLIDWLIDRAIGRLIDWVLDWLLVGFIWFCSLDLFGLVPFARAWPTVVL